jgi:NDP-sugar pyrophosphorylase family protein
VLVSPDVVVFLLAAGSGTRLAPLTESVPKPLIPLGDVPILERNIAALAAAGYRNLIINVHHLADTIMDQVGDGRRWGVSIHYSREKELLGTAGALQVQHERLQDSTFIVAYADNLLQCDLRAPLDAHRAAGATLTVTGPSPPSSRSRGRPIPDLRRSTRVCWWPSPAFSPSSRRIPRVTCPITSSPPSCGRASTSMALP